jgi:hypothetical protein
MLAAMEEVSISAQVVIQLMNGEPIIFTKDGKQESGQLHLRAVGPDKYFAHVTYPSTDRGVTQAKSIELTQEQVNTIGWSPEHNSFIARF